MFNLAFQNGFPRFGEAVAESCGRCDQGGTRHVLENARGLHLDFHLAFFGNSRIGAVEWPIGRRRDDGCGEAKIGEARTRDDIC